MRESKWVAFGTAVTSGVAFQAANTAIVDLAARGILREMTGRAYARLFAARRILGVFPNSIFQMAATVRQPTKEEAWPRKRSVYQT